MSPLVPYLAYTRHGLRREVLRTRSIIHDFFLLPVSRARALGLVGEGAEEFASVSRETSG